MEGFRCWVGTAGADVVVQAQPENQLKAQNHIDRALSVCRGPENLTVIAIQEREPVIDVAGVARYPHATRKCDPRRISAPGTCPSCIAACFMASAFGRFS